MLTTTETLDRLIATLAMSSDSTNPVRGYRIATFYKAARGLMIRIVSSPFFSFLHFKYFSNQSKLACMAASCIFGSFGPCGCLGRTIILVGTPCCFRAL